MPIQENLPSRQSGSTGNIEDVFVLLTMVALLGLAILHVKPFSDFMNAVGDIVSNTAKLAQKKG